jgi:hypothetical protein
MTLPSRNRRTVTIDSTQYHWVKGSRGDNGRGVVTVQLAEGQGAKLMIDPYGFIRDHEVPEAIRFALRMGWQPTESGPPMWIGFLDSENVEARFVLRDAKDPPYWRDALRTERAFALKGWNEVSKQSPRSE